MKHLKEAPRKDRSKSCDYNNEDDVNCLNIPINDNYKASYQKCSATFPLEFVQRRI